MFKAKMAMLQLLLHGTGAAAAGALCAMAYAYDNGMGVTTSLAMLLVFSGHVAIINTGWGMRTLAAGAILCLLARLFYCRRFRKRLTTMGAGFTSLWLLWPVSMLLHELSTTWRICGYQCCTGKLQSYGPQEQNTRISLTFGWT